MSNPQDPNQWAQQGWQQPGQPGQPPQGSDQTQITPQFGGQPPAGQPYAAPGADQTQIAPQFGGQWPGAQGQPGQYPQGQPGQPQPGQHSGQFGYPGQPGQPYGQFVPQYAGAPGMPGAPKKSKNGLIIGIGAAVVIAIVVIVVLVGYFTDAFFGKKFDNGAVNEGVTKVLKENYNESDTKDVKCNTDGVKVKEGSTFTCDATISGKQRTVDVKVLDSDGKYQVGAPN
ncbi:hypothetical protein TPAU25S_01648 [Tsukamurella paurometabola]|uniref:DUF4333 domain-containing protein n=1 Tax=Tsukamurella paurometabola (strain ATCC 8368 / DSM 20162 / CCUG 35730 / CIP 100753 / JCM 10117 / KCTC 9821 / NBRC 16120 / NCIMB 702349 / NCTC 13040) TaxID=521096 RepID=D5UPM6_TSUPD|nr:DUF4333 domain-containing protein [Tsukamurella paurometabola]ADG78782.1 conserved hypothetical protein [Tsukamurella paurometabola DSM 20162]SUP33134.1 Uncharacterised protein [Tsukamurella paurometabola]